MAGSATKEREQQKQSGTQTRAQGSSVVSSASAREAATTTEASGGGSGSSQRASAARSPTMVARRRAATTRKGRPSPRTVERDRTADIAQTVAWPHAGEKVAGLHVETFWRSDPHDRCLSALT